MLVTEIAYPTYRAPLTSLYNSLWYSGSIMYVFPTRRAFTILSSRQSLLEPHGQRMAPLR